MPSRWDTANRGWHRRVFHYPPPMLLSGNFRLPCAIELQPFSLTPLKMRKVQVRLFEGFVSFKNSEARPGSKAERIAAHKKDVLKLKNAVCTRANAQITDPGKLRQHPSHRIESAFPFLDEDLIPPVIRINLDA